VRETKRKIRHLPSPIVKTLPVSCTSAELPDPEILDSKIEETSETAVSSNEMLENKAVTPKELGWVNERSEIQV
jgi:hypothetical protein